MTTATTFDRGTSAAVARVPIVAPVPSEELSGDSQADKGVVSTSALHYRSQRGIILLG